MSNIGAIIVGKTGSGKSSFINALYLCSIFESDPEKENISEVLENIANKTQRLLINEEDVSGGASVTQNCSIHEIKLDNDHNLSLIDTPGMSDTQGISKDAINKTKIIEFLAATKVDIQYIFLIIANKGGADTFEYEMRELASIFPNYLLENTVLLISNCSNTDDDNSRELDILTDSGYKIKKTFKFNNVFFENFGTAKKKKKGISIITDFIIDIKGDFFKFLIDNKLPNKKENANVFNEYLVAYEFIIERLKKQIEDFLLEQIESITFTFVLNFKNKDTLNILLNFIQIKKKFSSANFTNIIESTFTETTIKLERENTNRFIEISGSINRLKEVFVSEYTEFFEKGEIQTLEENLNYYFNEIKKNEPSFINFSNSPENDQESTNIDYLLPKPEIIPIQNVNTNNFTVGTNLDIIFICVVLIILVELAILYRMFIAHI